MDVARRRLLRQQTPHWPLPWLSSLASLHDRCTRCDDCISACPQQIVIKGDGGFPCVDFGQGECTLCGKCAQSCRVEGLFDQTQTPFAHRATIMDHCLPKHGIACQSCADVCEVNAITFSWNSKRLREPSIDTDRCTGCGACYSVCAPNAIRLSNETPHD